MELIKAGLDPLDAAIAGVAIIEADPKDHSVGYGGLPNEDGVVELDAAVMHGPTHGGGAVASLRNIIHPAAVARLVMKRTQALPAHRRGGLAVRPGPRVPRDRPADRGSRGRSGSAGRRQHSEDWLPAPDGEVEPAVLEALKTRVHGTVHVSAIDTHGNLGCVTSTSGLAFKIPGRVGDSPILGAGLYLDNTVGSCRLDRPGRGQPAELLVVPDHRGTSAGASTSRTRWSTPASGSSRPPPATPGSATPRASPTFGVNFYGLTKDGQVAGALRRPRRIVLDPRRRLDPEGRFRRRRRS